jgi:hypothetical protein
VPNSGAAATLRVATPARDPGCKNHTRWVNCSKLQVVLLTVHTHACCGRLHMQPETLTQLAAAALGVVGGARAGRVVPGEALQVRPLSTAAVVLAAAAPLLLPNRLPRLSCDLQTPRKHHVQLPNNSRKWRVHVLMRCCSS